MSDFKKLDEYFKSIKFKELKYPALVGDAIAVLDDDETIPNKMKLFMALNECCTLVSNLGNHISLNKKTKITTNLFGIMFSESGTSKDSSIAKIRTCFKPAYAVILDKMKTATIENAKIACSEAEDGNSENWKDYYKGNTRTLFPSVSTDEGQMNQMSVLQGSGIGAYNMGISELGSELKSNPLLFTNLKSLAMGYDLGNISSKIVKTDELQTSDISGLNINTLMFSSIHTLMKDKGTKNKFVDTMTIQLSRRSLMYVNDVVAKDKQYGSVLNIINNAANNDNNFEKFTDKLERRASAIITAIPTGKDKEISFMSASGSVDRLEDMNVRDIYNAYKAYNKYRSDAIPNKYTMLSLSTRHLHWKALKIAGMFAMMSGKMDLDVKYLLQAISIVEYYNNDAKKFQIEVDKEVYEQIVDYCKLLAIDGKLDIAKHTLIKEGFVSSNVSDKRIKEYADLCTESDNNGIYSYKKGKLSYTCIKEIGEVHAEPEPEPVVEEEETPVEEDVVKIDKPIPNDNKADIRVSLKQFKASNGDALTFADNKASKEYRNMNGASNWKNLTTGFEYYAKLVNANVAYSPYHFKDGKNSKGVMVKGYKSLETIIDPSNTIVIDIDESLLTIHEMHEVLSEYTHVISTTSDATNLYKYRVILRLDRNIDLTPPQWRKFYRSITELLGMEADTAINKASMFQGYKGSVVLTKFDGEFIETKPHIIAAYETTEPRKEIVVAKTEKQFQMQWDDRFDDFEYAYDCNHHRSLALFGAMRGACEKGWTKQWVEELIDEINSTIPRPMKQSTLKRTILDQIGKYLIV